MASCCETHRGKNVLYSRMTMHQHTVQNVRDSGQLQTKFLKLPGRPSLRT